MKTKVNAKQKREAEAQRRKGAFSTKTPEPPKVSTEKLIQPKSTNSTVYTLPNKSPEEETREFLEYLERYDTKGMKDDLTKQAKRNPVPAGYIYELNIKEGMPIVSDAIQRLHTGIQELRVARVKTIKLVHGYGSTGRGGKIRIAVQEELAVMKRRKMIRDYIPGEEFGPTNAASRALVEQNNSVRKDPDYGRMNHGITIVVL